MGKLLDGVCGKLRMRVSGSLLDVGLRVCNRVLFVGVCYTSLS